MSYLTHYYPHNVHDELQEDEDHPLRGNLTLVASRHVQEEEDDVDDNKEEVVKSSVSKDPVDMRVPNSDIDEDNYDTNDDDNYEEPGRNQHYY